MHPYGQNPAKMTTFRHKVLSHYTHFMYKEKEQKLDLIKKKKAGKQSPCNGTKRELKGQSQNQFICSIQNKIFIGQSSKFDQLSFYTKQNGA